jgi:hypothetical protein
MTTETTVVRSVSVCGHTLYLLQHDNLYGWCRQGETVLRTGLMYNGKPYSISRCTFTSLQAAIDDLQNELSYYHGIRRSVSGPQIAIPV